MLVSFENVGFGYDDNLNLTDVSFTLNEAEKVGLVGANGEGKTTLIRLLLGELDATYGKVILKNGLRIGYLAQNGGYESANTVYGEMLAVFRKQLDAVEKLGELSARLSQCEYGGGEYRSLSSKIEALEKYVTANDCYNVEVKIKTVLNGMGFGAFYGNVISTMSGGEKTRLKLARLLLEEPDLLVLDEPTNHLDIKTLFWLEDYLAAFKGAVFVVSHDRYFLDKTVTRTLEVENKKVVSFAGNYTKYKMLKAERVERQRREYEKQQEERAKLQDYIDRNLVRASTTKMAQSRRNKLEKMEVQEKPYLPPKPPKFSFTYDISPYERVLTVHHLTLAAGGKTLLEDACLELLRGQKLAVVGENGTGKSTFLKHVASGGDPSVERGRFVRLACYDQENANLNGENTVLAEMWERHTGATQTEIRAELARCGLTQEDMAKQVKSLSGGERAKLALCVFESERGNVLLLDEPTNHLDLPARESLESALKAFDGTVMFVSHDRYFISAVADRVAEIEGKKLTCFDGGYDVYNKAKREAAERAAEEERQRERREFEAKKQGAYRSRQERAEEARRKARMKEIEAAISLSEREEASIGEQLSDPRVAADYGKVLSLSARLGDLKKQLDALYAEYETLI